MANIECKDCGDLVDVEARTVTLPFVCKWCEEGFTYTTPRYIIQYEGCDGWIRSENTDARGVFDDFSVASAVAAAETDNGDGLVYRVVPYGTPDVAMNEPRIVLATRFIGVNGVYSTVLRRGGEYPGFDTQEPKSGSGSGSESEPESESDEICHCNTCEPEVEPESEPESEGLEDQFELDTKLIEDLSNQLAEANNQIKSLENSLDYNKKSYNRLYKDFSELETRYTVERDKTWWERLWS